ADDYAETWHDVAERGPSAIGRIFSNPPKELIGNPANRAFMPPGVRTGVLRSWLEDRARALDWNELAPYSIDEVTANHLLAGDAAGFIAARQSKLIEQEHDLQLSMGMTPSRARVADAPVDTE
ncbi:MAG: hypothetical protein SYR96_03190, partial [Actinomycetota bacterium]|nr:hypothetical protein [Actinomycetota bacterium]